MFDAERLLGKIVGEVIGGSRGAGGSILEGLSSGGGLMTVIGLGVGAYEILKEQKVKQGGSGPGTVAPPPPPGGAAPGGPPPPPVPPAAPVAATSDQCSGIRETVDGDELACRMIRVMIAAAHADGVLDQEEQRAILDKLESADLSEDEKSFLARELNEPWSIERLCAGVSEPSVARTMYMLAVTAITVDTERERDWLDRLAEQLGIGSELKAFIEEQYGAG